MINTLDLTTIKDPALERVALKACRLFGVESNSVFQDLASSRQGQILLIKAFLALSSLVGGDVELVSKWMLSYNKHFKQIPENYIRREGLDGLLEVCLYLESCAHH